MTLNSDMMPSRITKAELEIKKESKQQKAEIPGQFICAVDAALSVIGGKWKLMIVHELFRHIYRHGELLRLLPGITQKVLTQQLRDLERDGIIARKDYQEVPPRVEYSITEFGKTLEPIVKAADAWGHEYAEDLVATRKQSDEE